MSLDNRTWFQKGLKDGIPIALGYFAVSFYTWDHCKNAGLTALQAMLASFTLNASAGGIRGLYTDRPRGPDILKLPLWNLWQMPDIC